MTKMIRKRKPWRYWTKEKVVKRLGDLAEERGESYLRPSNLREKEGDLFNAIWRIFGSFEVAIEEAGYNYENLIRRKPAGYWTKEKVINRLRGLAAEYGESYLRNLRKKELDLNEAAQRIFGSFRLALQEAGFDYEEIYNAKPPGYWTKEKVITRLRSLAKEHGEIYLTQNLQKRDSRLYLAIVGTFGSLKAALEEAGYDYEEISGRKPVGYWTKERVVQRLRGLAAKHGEGYLYSSNLQKNEPSVYGASIKVFGSLKEALEEAGFDYWKITKAKFRYWTEKKVIERLRNLAEKHGEDYLCYVNLCKNEPSLLGASQSLFGSLTLAVKKAGYNYEKISGHKPRGYWTKKNVVKKLKTLAEEHGEIYLRPSNLEEKEGDLINAIWRIFGRLETALEEAGYDYEEISGHKPRGYWTKENIVKKLRNLADEHGKAYLAPSNLRENEGNLFNAIWKTFGSFETPIKEAGFDHEKIKRPLFGIPKIWKAWEKCCREIAEEIFGSSRILFKKTIKRTRLYPDLQIPNKELIIDAKLSAWDRASIDEDIDNYINYCDKLEFWCLEGAREITNNTVVIVSARDLLKRLKDAGIEENRWREFRKKIALIKKGIDPYEGAQKEIREYFS